MTLQILDYELNYWKLTYTKHQAEKYLSYLREWGINPGHIFADGVLEVGTGPFMGILPFIGAGFKVGMDPNYANFEQLGMLKWHDDILYVCEWLQTCHISGKFSTIFMADGVEAIKDGGLSTLRNFLTPSGQLYLHFHLRRADQLTEGHKVPFLLDDLSKYTDEANLTLVWSQLYPEDPIPQYTNGQKLETVMGLWTRSEET